MQLVSATPQGMKKDMKDIVEECLRYGLTLDVGQHITLTDLESMNYLVKEKVGFVYHYVWSDTYPVYIQLRQNNCLHLFNKGDIISVVYAEDLEEESVL